MSKSSKANNDEMVYGLHAIRSLLTTSPQRIKTFYIQAGLSSKAIKALIEQATELRVSMQQVAKKQLDQMTDGGRHQGILAICQGKAFYNENDLEELLGAASGAPLVLVLDEVEDPHNLGACLRTADAAGATCVIVPKRHSAPINAIVHKVSSGASQTVPIVQVGNLARALQKLAELGVWMVGTSAEAKQSLYQTDLTGPIALVLGNEGKGLKAQTEKVCDFLVHLPMQGTVESLNISVANAVCLYEAVRQRQPKH